MIKFTRAFLNSSLSLRGCPCEDVPVRRCGTCGDVGPCSMQPSAGRAVCDDSPAGGAAATAAWRWEGWGPMCNFVGASDSLGEEGKNCSNYGINYINNLPR